MSGTLRGSGLRRVLLVFLDGVGIGLADPDRNPFLPARLPILRDLLGGEIPTLDRPELSCGAALAFPLDATMGVEGVPQSGTGQTALLTGSDAPRLFGRHFGPWTPVRLRPLLERESVLRRTVDAGLETVFANAYPREFLRVASPRHLAAAPLAARAAGLLGRHAEALARGEAVASEIVNTGWRERLGHAHVPEVTPREAGRTLARLAAGARFTLFAHYATDHAGHRGGMAGAVAALERVDSFLEGVLEGLPGDVLLAVSSDHGNVEDVSAGHTRNPVLSLLVGPASREVRAGARTIADVAGALLRPLGL